MRRGLKITFGIIFSILMIISAFFYLSLYGLPFKKSSVAKDIRKHLEEKYEQEVELERPFYNFKDGKYGGLYIIDDIEFYAEEGYNDHKYIDTYADEVWVIQLQEDFQAIYKEIFPRAINLKTHFVHDRDLVISGPEIPRYDEVDSMLGIRIDIDEPFTDQDDQWDAINQIVMQVQEKSPFIDSAYSFIDETDDRETFITCPDKATNEITSVDDAKKHCEQTVFSESDK